MRTSVTGQQLTIAEFLNHAKSYAASVILTFAYGKTTPTLFSDPDVREVNECLERLGEYLCILHVLG